MPENLPRVGSALLVRDEANRILLGQRNKDPQRGAWVIPGGKIHAFESIAEAAAREIEEETGLKVEVQNQFGVYEIVNPPTEHRIVIYSWGKVVGGKAKGSDDLSEVKFFSLRELGDVPTTPLVRRVLQDARFIPGETEPLPCSHVQLNLFGHTLGIVPRIEQNAGETTEHPGQIEQEGGAVSSQHTQLSLFEDSVAIGQRRGQAFHGIFVESIRTLLGWFHYLRQGSKFKFSMPGEGLRVRFRNLFREPEGRRVPILLAGATEELSSLHYNARSRRRPRKRDIIKSGLLFDMSSAR
jgi:acetyl-CoA carboxylase carboxyl transferase subunit beta